MSVTVVPRRSSALNPVVVPGASQGLLGATYLAFLVFLLANGVLYVRPTEYVEGVLGAQLFLIIMGLCLILGFPAVLGQVFGERLTRQPLLLFPLLLWPMIVLSDASRGRLDEAVTGFLDFSRVVPYYLLLLALVISPERLRWMLGMLAFCAFIITLIAVLQYHEVIQLELFKQLQDNQTKRLRATGIFADPNDLGALIVVAVLCCLFFLRRNSFLLAPLWLGMIGLFLYAIYLTHSRGTLMALGAGIFMLLRSWLGTFRAVALGCLMLPGLLLFSGREVDLSNRHDTAVTRVGHWSDALVEFLGSPVFGVGYQNLPELIGLVAHNSYLHAFAELGFVGGCIFLGMWIWAAWALLSLTSGKRQIVKPEVADLHPTMCAILVAYMVSIFSLSLCYVHPTYTVLGLVAVYLKMATTRPPMAETALTDRFALWLVMLGVVFLGSIKILIPIMRLLGG